jgi:hypothetical protein
MPLIELPHEPKLHDPTCTNSTFWGTYYECSECTEKRLKEIEEYANRKPSDAVPMFGMWLVFLFGAFAVIGLLFRNF